MDEVIWLNGDAYKKRTKVFLSDKWIDTKPIIINLIDKSLVVYKRPILSLVTIKHSTLPTIKTLGFIPVSNFSKNTVVNNNYFYTLFLNGVVVYPLLGFFLIRTR